MANKLAGNQKRQSAKWYGKLNDLETEFREINTENSRDLTITFGYKKLR